MTVLLGGPFSPETSNQPATSSDGNQVQLCESATMLKPSTCEDLGHLDGEVRAVSGDSNCRNGAVLHSWLHGIGRNHQPIHIVGVDRCILPRRVVQFRHVPVRNRQTLIDPLASVAAVRDVIPVPWAPSVRASGRNGEKGDASAAVCDSRTLQSA